MARAIWNDTVLAESDQVIKLEGNLYFPPDSVHQQYLKSSDTHTHCFWKGQASYYHIEVNGEKNPDAAWTYPVPKAAADNIRNYIAFWHGVEVQE